MRFKPFPGSRKWEADKLVLVALFPALLGVVCVQDVFAAKFRIVSLKQLIPHECVGRKPAWRSHGKKVVFQSERDGNRDVRIINVGKSGIRGTEGHPGRASGVPLAFESDNENKPVRNVPANLVRPYARVNDYSDKLTDSQENKLNKKILDFERETTIQIGVLILPTIKPYFDNHKEFATETSNRWGIGQKHKDNGLFLTIATEDRQVRLSTGYGMESVFTDQLCGEILDDHVVPYLRKGDYHKAISECLESIFLISRNNMSKLQKEWDSRIGISK